MKARFLASCTVAIFGLLGGITVASATCIEGCVQPPPVNNAGFSVVGNAFSNGSFAAQFTGGTGEAFGKKLATAGTEVKLNGAGNGCTVNCGTFNWTGLSFGSERVESGVFGKGTASGVPVMGINENRASAGAALQSGWVRLP